MASEGAGKARTKRYINRGRQNERRKSLIGIVTDTVKGLFRSSWSQDIAENNSQSGRDNQQEQDKLQNPTTSHGSENHLGQSYIQPPPMSTGTPMPSKPMPQMPMPLVPGLQGTLGPIRRQDPLPFSSEHLPFGQYQPKSSSMIVNGGDDRSELSECSISTSGCSSMAPHQDKKGLHIDGIRNTDSRIHQMRQEFGGSITPSKELEARSMLGNKDMSHRSEKSFLWSGSPRRPQSPAKRKAPSFNVSIFGTSVSADKSVLGSSQNDSIYYPGKTIFGGASATKKRKLQDTSPPQLTPNKRQVRAKPLNSSMGGISSSSARRILSTLERMSSPLSDAKKIPSYNSSMVDSPLSFTPSSFANAARRRSMPYRMSSSGLLRGPPVHALSTPGTVQIAKNFYTLPQTMNHPNQIPASRSNNQQTMASCQSASPAPVPHIYNDPSSGGGKSGKMKRERGQHYTTKKDEEDIVEVPDLPTEFTLPVSDMPKFDFKPSSASSSTPLPVSESKIPSKSTISSFPSTGNGPFTFSSPIPQSNPEHIPSSNSQSFQFSSPIHLDNSAPKSSGFLGAKHTNMPSALPAASNPDLGFQFDPSAAKRKTPLFKSTPDVVEDKPMVDSSKSEGSFTAANELKTGSVMDILGKNSSANKIASSPADELKQGSVMDFLGGGSKKEDAQPSLSDMFKKSADTWDCPVCMINNKAALSKCAACQAVKPGRSPSKGQYTIRAPPSDESLSSGPSLSSLFQKPAGAWECPTCMIQNKSTAAKCVACETNKPGGESKNKPQTTDISNLPAVDPTLASKFKKPEGSWECDTCMVSNNAAATKCIACETSKPGIKKATSFTSAGGFKIPPTGGFTFGGAATTVSTTSGTAPTTNGGFTFGQSLAKDQDKKDSKSLEGGFKFGAPLNGKTDAKSDVKSESTLAGGFKFGQSLADDSIKSDSSGGFKFGQSLATDSENNKVKSDQNKNDVLAKPLEGGFSFGASKTDEVDGKSIVTKSESSTVGGFKFGQSLDSSKNETSGGFKFGAPTGSVTDTKSNNTAVVAPTFGGAVAPSATSGFTLGTSKPTEDKPSTPFGASDKKDSTPAVGLFAFGQANTDQKPGFMMPSAIKTDTQPAGIAGGFNFKTGDMANSSSTPLTSSTGIFTASTATSSAPASGFSFGTQSSAPAKTQAAAPFTFGAGASTQLATTTTATTQSPFTFGATAKPNTAAPAFNFKGAATTNGPSATTTTTASGLFSFPTKPAESNPSTAAPGVFGFGQNAQTSTTTASAANPVFAFGQATQNTATTTTNAVAPTPVFAFGQNAQSTSTTAGTAPSFTFGQTATANTAAPAFGATAPSFGFTKSASTPAFGSMAKTTATSNMFSVTTTTAAPAPAFGSTPAVPNFGGSAPAANPSPFATSTPNPSAFGASNTAAPPAFGATATPFGGPTASSSSTGGFGSSGSGFQFGAPQAPAPTPAAPGVFQFGQSNPPATTGATASTGFNFGQTAQVPGAFNFSAGNPASPPANNFQFNAQPSTPAGVGNPFSVTPAPSNTGRRPIKKAQRRVQRK